MVTTVTKSIISACFVGVALLPSLSKFNLSPTTPELAYVVITGCLLSILYAIVSGTETKYVIVMSGSLVLGIFAAYQAPLVEGTLFGWDQHIGAHVIQKTVAYGHFPQSTQMNLRGAGVSDIYPLLYSFSSLLSILTDVETFTITKVMPGLVLPLLPLIGSAIVSTQRGYIALLWTTPIFFSFSAATTGAQMFALPIFALLLYGLVRTRRDNQWPIRVIFIISAISITLAHSLTPIVALVLTIGFAVGGIVSDHHDFLRRATVFGVILTGFWLLMNHSVFLNTLGALIESGLIAVIGHLSERPPAVSPPGKMTPPVETSGHVPLPIWSWVGLYLRFVFFLALAGLFFLVEFSSDSLIDGLTHPYVTSFLLAGPFILASSVILHLVNLNRSWLMLSLSATFAFVYVLSRLSDAQSLSGHAVISLVVFSVGGAILFTSIYYHISSSGPLPDTVVFPILTTVVFTVLASITFGYISIETTAWEPLLSGSESLKNLSKYFVLILILGHMFWGLPLSTFSSDTRAQSFQEPGLTHYHKAWDYRTSEFLSAYSEGRVSGDSRVFLLEEYYRQDLTPTLSCYVPEGECPIDYVVWFDVYRTMWQGIDIVGHIHTRFPGGEEFLDRTELKVYTTNHSSVYVDG